MSLYKAVHALLVFFMIGIFCGGVISEKDNGTTSSSGVPKSIPPLDGVKRLVYKVGLLPPLFHVVAEEDSIQSFVELLRFKTKEMCECAHYETLILEYAKENVEFSICSHCLDYRGNFKMPQELWNKLQGMRNQNSVEPGN